MGEKLIPILSRVITFVLCVFISISFWLSSVFLA